MSFVRSFLLSFASDVVDLVSSIGGCAVLLRADGPDRRKTTGHNYRTVGTAHDKKEIAPRINRERERDPAGRNGEQHQTTVVVVVVVLVLVPVLLRGSLLFPLSLLFAADSIR